MRSSIGWQSLHSAVDDHSWLAYSEIHPHEIKASGLVFLFNALRFSRRHGAAIECVMTDNGSASKSRRYAKALRCLDIRHKHNRLCTPKPTLPSADSG